MIPIGSPEDLTMTLIHQPFDKLFKQSLKERQVALDFFKAHLPAGLYNRIDWKSLTALDKSYLSPALQATHSDLVFSCQIDGKTGYIPLIFLAEHFSMAPEHIAFRFLQYTLSAMEDHLKAGHNRLPLILPICVYHGKQSPFPHSTDIYDEFEDTELARQLVFKPFQLIDLTVLDEEAIQQHGTAALMELLLKRAWVKSLLSTFRQLLESGILKQVLGQTTETYLLSVLNYALHQGDENESVEAFIQLLAKELPERKEMIMTFAEQLRQQGHQEGMQKGIQKGRQEEARAMVQNLRAMGMDNAFIGKVTKLSDEGVTTLLKQTH